MTTPSLQDILEDKHQGPYNRQNFMKYLGSNHCLENIEFIMDINHYNKLNGHDKARKWSIIKKSYLCDDSVKEINVPYNIKSNLVKQANSDYIKRAYKIIYELLLDSYNQFIKKQQKLVAQQSSQGRRSSVSQPLFGGSSSSTSRSGSVSQPVSTSRRGSASQGPPPASSSGRRDSTSHSTSRRGSSSAQGSGRRNSVHISSSTGTSSFNLHRANSIDYPKSPISNNTLVKPTINKLPSPQSDIESKKKNNLFKMKKFKFRRNSNE